MTEKPSIYEAVASVMADVQAVGKKDRNTEQNYSFRGIDAVVNAAGPAFRKHGIVPVPLLQKAGYRDVQTSRGKPSRECTVEVSYRFYGPAGDYIEATVPGESMDFGDKGAAKAMSVAYRIALLQVLCIPTDEPDSDSASYERGRDEWEAARPATVGQSPMVEPPKSVDEHQLKIIHTIFGEVGYGGDQNRDPRLAVMSAVVGRPLTSSKELTAPEASAVIAELRRKAAGLPAKEAQQ